jgi:hypothetical protein
LEYILLEQSKKKEIKETHSTRRGANKCLKVVVIKSEDGIPLFRYTEKGG